MEFLASLSNPGAMVAFFQVLMIDLALAGDNAVAVGLAAAGLAAHQRKRAIMLGLIAAVIMRIGFALITVQLLQVVGLLLAGGILLLWVCWKMYRELAEQGREESAEFKHLHPWRLFQFDIVACVLTYARQGNRLLANEHFM